MKTIGQLIFFLLMAYLVNAQHTLSDRVPDILYQDALELYQKEKYAAAQRKFKKYLAYEIEGEKYIQSSYYLAFCALHLNNPDFENRILSFIHSYPGHSKARQASTDLGFYYFDQGEYAKAVEYLEKNKVDRVATESQIEHTYKLAYAYFMSDKKFKARPLFDAIQRGDHKYALLSSYYAGYLAYQDGDYEEALESLERASEDPQLEKETEVLIPSIYYRQQEYLKVLEFAERLEKTKGRLPNGLNLIVGDCYFLNRRYAQAATYIADYVKNTSSSIDREVYYRLGYSYFNADRLEEAVTYLSNAALGNDSLSQVSAYHLGVSYIKLNQKEKALISFEQCRRMDFVPRLKELSAFYFIQVSFDAEDFNACIEGCEYYLRNFGSSSDKEMIQQVYTYSTQSYLHTGDYQKALDAFDRIGAKSYEIKVAYQQIAFNKAVQDYNDSENRQAIEMLKKSLAYPMDRNVVNQANFWLGEIYSLESKYDSAVLFYQKVPASFEDAPKLMYGKAYAYYNTKQYAKAVAEFTGYVQSGAAASRAKTIDALIRLADCYYVTKEYSRALKVYDLALSNQPDDTDYILLMKGMTFAASNQNNDAINAYDQVIRREKSSYREQALYRMAMVYFGKGRNTTAIQYFSQLIHEYHKGEFLLEAHAKRALASVPQNFDQAIYDYKQLIDLAPNSVFARSAFSSLGEIRNQGVDVPEYEKYIAKFKAANPNDEEVTRFDYNNAKGPFLQGKYAEAVNSLRKYLQDNPNSPYKDDALYTLGYSLELVGEGQAAIQAYLKIEDPKFGIRATKNIADIYFNQAEYGKAINYYKDLQDNASNKSYYRTACLGLMRSYFFIMDFEGCDLNANRIIADDYKKALPEAYLYKAKVAYMSKKYDEALVLFQELVDGNNNRTGAESQYYIGKTLRDMGDLASSNAALIEVRKRFEGYPEWIYKAFLLISENYADQGNLFQAEATLQSIIDYAEDPVIRDQARKKLAELIGKEKDAGTSQN